MSTGTGFVDACCKLPPAQSDYNPTGEEISIGDMKVYIVGEKGKPAVVMCYDIFGFHPCTKQVADMVASQGFRVALPNFFRENPWPENDPIEFEKLLAHLDKYASWEKKLPSDYAAVEARLKEEGSPSFFGIGFCWGGSVAVKAASVEGNLYKGVASPHPSMINVQAIEKLTAPLFLLPSKDDPDMVPVIEAVKAKPFGAKSAHKRFDDMHHGWCAARADFSNPANAERTAEAVGDITTWFKSLL